MKLTKIYDEILSDKSPSLKIESYLKKLGLVLEREIKVGNNLSSKLSRINSRLSKKILDFLNSDNIKDVNVDYVDYDPENEKLLTLGFKDNRGNDRTKKVKLLKLLSYLGAEINDIKGYEVEELISYLKKGDLDNFKIVEGDDILKAYHCENYDEGETMGSCMRFDSAQRYLEIYTNNPNQIKCLVLINPENNKVRGRALLWKLDDGTTFMDRVYVTNKQYDKDFNTYAEKHGLSKGHPKDEVTLENGGDYDFYPYMDTFMFYTPMVGLLSASHGEMELQDTNGGDSSGVYSDFYDERIPEDEAVYVDHMQDYFYESDVSIDWAGSEYLFINSDDVVQISLGEHKGEYALDSETIEDYDGEIILNDYASEIEFGEYAGEYASDDELVEDYDDRMILSKYAEMLNAGEYEGHYAPEDEVVQDYVGDVILEVEAIKCNIGSINGEFILKTEAFIFTSGRNKGFVFHESDEEEISNSGESYVEYLEISENENKLKLTNLYEEILDEEYPSSFNMEEFKTLNSFNKRIKYCESNLTRISSGSSRIVYSIDNEKVLKLAKNSKGLAQNEVEIEYGQYHDLTDIVAKIFDYEDNGLWVEMELARKVKLSDFKRITGFDFKTFSIAITNYGNKTNQHKNRMTYPKLNSKITEAMWEDEFVYEIFNFIGNYDLPVGDLTRLNSYGIVKRGGGDAIVIIDYGLTHDVYNSYYS